MNLGVKELINQAGYLVVLDSGRKIPISQRRSKSKFLKLFKSHYKSFKITPTAGPSKLLTLGQTWALIHAEYSALASLSSSRDCLSENIWLFLTLSIKGFRYHWLSKMFEFLEDSENTQINTLICIPTARGWISQNPEFTRRGDIN